MGMKINEIKELITASIPDAIVEIKDLATDHGKTTPCAKTRRGQQ